MYRSHPFWSSLTVFILCNAIALTWWYGSARATGGVWSDTAASWLQAIGTVDAILSAVLFDLWRREDEFHREELRNIKLARLVGWNISGAVHEQIRVVRELRMLMIDRRNANKSIRPSECLLPIGTELLAAKADLNVFSEPVAMSLTAALFLLESDNSAVKERSLAGDRPYSEATLEEVIERCAVIERLLSAVGFELRELLFPNDPSAPLGALDRTIFGSKRKITGLHQSQDALSADSPAGQ